jgi:O-antigen/teichoic acid export membrane protein
MSRPAGDSQHRHDLVRLARGAALNLGGAGVSGVLGFVLAVVVARGLGAAQSGVFFATIAFVNIVGAVTELGAPSGVVRQISRFRAIGRAEDVPATLRSAIVPVAVIGVVIGAVMYAAAPELGRFIAGDEDGSEAAEYLRVAALFVAVSGCASVLTRAFQGFGQMLPVVILQMLLLPVLRTLLCGGAVLVGLEAAGIGLAWYLPVLVVLVASIPWLRIRVSQTRVESVEVPRPSSQVASEFWRFTAFQAVATVVQVVLLRLDVVLVSSLRSAEEAGIYAAASRYLTFGVMISTAVVFVIGPQLSGMIAQRSFGRARGVYQAATMWLSAISFPIYLALAAFAPLMLRLFGEKFTQGATALTILSLAMLVNMGTGAVRAALFMGGKSSWILLDNAVALAVNVALNLILIPEYGMSGAAVSWAASIVAGNLLPLFQVWRLWGLQPLGPGYGAVTLSAIGCFGLTGLIARATLGDSIPAFVMYAVVGTALYALSAWRLRDRLQLAVLWDAVRVRGARATQPAATI